MLNLDRQEVTVASFVDHVVLHVAAGDGGNGCASIHREKFKPLGGPDGGNGGRGGDVVLVVDPSTTTLLDYHHSPHRRAGSGKAGQGSHRGGAEGADIVLPVPEGTVVKNADGVVLAGDVRFTIADVPGLIPGASEGKGLGLEFLRHVERCSVLAHVVDCAT